MEALAARDKLFSDLYTEHLKRAGFKKRGRWCTRQTGDLVQAFFLRSSRFGDQSEAVFWIDLMMFHEGWHRLVVPERAYKCPSEECSLYLQELGEWCEPPMASFKISAETNLPALKNAIASGVENRALPLFSACQTPEALLSHLLSEKGKRAPGIVEVGLSYMLGFEDQARELLETAKAKATHENHARYLELRAKNIWG